jgi:hypothetical protein
VDDPGRGQNTCVGLGEAGTEKGDGVPSGDVDPTVGRELRDRLARLTELERDLLERLTRADLAAEDAPADVIADIKRKLGVTSSLAAVAVLVRARSG